MTRNLHLMAAVLALLLCGGCQRRPGPVPPAPAPQSLIVLLPNDDGSSSGSLLVTNAGGSQQLATPYSAVKVSQADSAPTAPAQMDPAEVQSMFAATLAAMPAPEARFNLYFETGGTVLTAQSAAELTKIVEAYRERRSTDLTIIGHTDTVADRRTNYQLALERAQHISKSIQALGVGGEHIFIESHGENDLLVPTADNVDEPRNRRVEIIVR